MYLNTGIKPNLNNYEIQVKEYCTQFLMIIIKGKGEKAGRFNCLGYPSFNSEMCNVKISTYCIVQENLVQSYVQKASASTVVLKQRWTETYSLRPQHSTCGLSPCNKRHSSITNPPIFAMRKTLLL